MSHSSNEVIAVDFGGTKASVACVSRSGEVRHNTRFAPSFSQGADVVLSELAAAIKEVHNQASHIETAVIASAGPLDPKSGCWLNPTNMFTDGKHWGQVNVVSPIKEQTGLDVYLENDAAAAVLAEGFFGRAKGCENYIVMTLGTGVGVGTVCNSQLVRSGRGLHPESSHIFLDFNDKTAPDGDGNFGTLESYLAGKSFSERMAKQLGVESLSGEDLLSRYNEGDQAIVSGFDDYAYKMALAINSLVVLYAPEKIFFSGGFSAALEIFKEPCEKHLEKLLSSRRVGVDLLPILELSGLEDRASLLGAAAVAFRNTNV